MKALEEGKKVRRVDWEVTKFIGRYECSCGEKEKNCCIYHMHSDHYNYEWEIYKEPQNTYTWMEVVVGLKDGKKFSRLSWKNKYYIHWEDRWIYKRMINVPEKNIFHGYIEEFEATDWIEVTE